MGIAGRQRTFARVIFNLLPMDGRVMTRVITCTAVEVLALGSDLDPRSWLIIVSSAASTGSRFEVAG